MKSFTVIFFLLINLNLSAQNIEVISGGSVNSFVNLDKFFSTNYRSGFGHSLKIGLTGEKSGNFFWRITMGYNRYNGKFNYNSGGFNFNGGVVVNAKIDKAFFTLGLFPFNFKFWEKVDLNLGLEIGRLFRDGFSGTFQPINSIGLLGQKQDIQSIYDRLNSKISVGLRYRIAYDIKVGDHLYLSPQYSLFIGLSDEFIQNPRESRSIRNFIGLGIEKRL